MAVNLFDLIERQGGKRLSESTRAAIADEFRRGDKISEIAARYGVSYNTVRYTARRYGVPPRSAGGRWKQPASTQVQAVLELWAEGLPLTRIGVEVGLGPKNVARVLVEQGVKRVDEPRSRARGQWSSNWKGGRRPAPGGYVYVSVPEGPFACMRQSQGYVLEHRLVMAKRLGRPLRVDETVHHINGEKSDNRPSNLQLRMGAHGPHAAFRCADCGSCNIEAVELEVAEPSP